MDDDPKKYIFCFARIKIKKIITLEPKVLLVSCSQYTENCDCNCNVGCRCCWFSFSGPSRSVVCPNKAMHVIFYSAAG